MANPGFENKGDFLTLQLSDEMFAANNEQIVDDCILFLLAAT